MDFRLCVRRRDRWAYSYCLLNRANIRIDAVYNQMGLRTGRCLIWSGLAALTYYVICWPQARSACFRIPGI